MWAPNETLYQSAHGVVYQKHLKVKSLSVTLRAREQKATQKLTTMFKALIDHLELSLSHITHPYTSFKPLISHTHLDLCYLPLYTLANRRKAWISVLNSKISSERIILYHSCFVLLPNISALSYVHSVNNVQFLCTHGMLNFYTLLKILQCVTVYYMLGLFNWRLFGWTRPSM